jgi:ATP-dependent exoDNAse (exonuclease V) beta subunit
MTVHKAKGLEFPVVILADLTCRLNRGDANRYLDPGARLCAMKLGGWSPHELHDHEIEEVARDQAEGVRLAYVAATRARDLLVVPALGDEPWEGGWFSPLNSALYPPLDARRDATRGARCPAFRSKDTVLQRPNEETAAPSTVAPGAHAFPDGGYSIVWWDPGALNLGVKTVFGVRRDDLIVKDVPRDVIAGGRARYDRWCLARADARAAGATPSVVVRTAKEWADETASGSLPEVTVVNVAAPDTGRGGGAAFGVLVHTLLSQAPFDAPAEQLEALADVEARVLGLSGTDASAAARVAGKVLAHDIIARARRAERRGACRRETPVTCRLADGTVVEGIVDLAFEENGEWIVVDYKSDRVLAAEGEERYRRQIGFYVSAIGQATGLRASGVLVRV